MTKNRIFLFYFLLSIIIFTLVFILANSSLGRISEPAQYGPWINFSTTVEGTKKIIQQIEINKSTEIPFQVKYNNESIVVKEIMFGENIWTPYGENPPGVVIKEGESPKLPDYGFRVILESGERLTYASFRSIRPDGLYDSIPYKILSENLIKTTEEEWEESKLILQYKASLELIKDDPINPDFNLIITSEEVEVGKRRVPVITGVICYKTNPIFYLANSICLPYRPFSWQVFYWYFLSLIITFLLYKTKIHDKIFRSESPK